MQLQVIKKNTMASGKRCGICSQSVKVGEKGFVANVAASYHRTVKVWHYDCLSAMVNDSQGLVDLCHDLAVEAENYDASGNPQAGEGMRRALNAFLTVISEKKALTARETQAQRVEREFNELQAALQAQHAPKIPIRKPRKTSAP
jgi:hypothetical protein